MSCLSKYFFLTRVAEIVYEMLYFMYCTYLKKWNLSKNIVSLMFVFLNQFITYPLCVQLMIYTRNNHAITANALSSWFADCRNLRFDLHPSESVISVISFNPCFQSNILKHTHTFHSKQFAIVHRTCIHSLLYSHTNPGWTHFARTISRRLGHKSRASRSSS